MGGSCTSCITIDWPAPKLRTYLDGQDRPRGDWMGSLLQDQRDQSGMLYRRNRYYDPHTGRFTQEDPTGIAGGLNSYGYAGGDPATFTDPFGLCPPQDDNPCTFDDLLVLTWSFGAQARAGITVGGKGIYIEGQLGPVVGVEMNGDHSTPFHTESEMSLGGGVQLPLVSGGGKCDLLSDCSVTSSFGPEVAPSTERTLAGSRGTPTKVGLSAFIGIELGINHNALREIPRMLRDWGQKHLRRHPDSLK